MGWFLDSSYFTPEEANQRMAVLQKLNPQETIELNEFDPSEAAMLWFPLPIQSSEKVA